MDFALDAANAAGSEQQMPARIWAYESLIEEQALDLDAGCKGDTLYIRSDIAERMAEALEGCMDSLKFYQATGGETYRAARSAISAFKDSAQDRGAS